MPVISVGDGAQHFMSMRNGGAIKSELSRLAESLSTGQVTDITATLRGETTQFSGINYSLVQLEGYALSARETGLTLGSIQTVLRQVDNVRSDTSNQLLLLNDSSNKAQVDESGRSAREAFDVMVATLNTRLADRSLMAGTSVNDTPLASADDMLADIQLAIGGTVDPSDIVAAIDGWFDDPAGGFATNGYLGDTGDAPKKRISESYSVELDARADDPAIRDVLKAAAIAAIANDLPGLDIATKSDLLQTAGQQLFGSATGIVAVQSRIGFAEGNVEQTMAQISAQQTSLGMSKNDLISADPFETASRLQSVQLQLETHYNVTARLSQLSLLDYI